MKFFLFILFTIWCLGALYGLKKRPPKGFSTLGPWRPATELAFLYDLSYRRQGRRRHEQRILAAMLREIEEAEHFIILDVFLFNRLGGREVLGDELASPVERVTEALLAARRRKPQLAVLLISDEVNTGYGSYAEPYLERLAAGGVEVVIADLDRLPDSNPLYSGLWRTVLQWFKPRGGGRLPNIFTAEAPGMSTASYLRLLNFKANHRKVLITERAALVSSANIHDASARHSNIAFRVAGGVIADMAAGELAVARFSGHDFTLPPAALAFKLPSPPPAVGENEDFAACLPPPGEPPLVRHLSEKGIKQALLRGLAAAGAGDRVWVAQFYLTERRVIAALAAAAHRGARVRVILDPSRDAFGHDKHGIPNRGMAARLQRKGGANLEIRWYNTQSEQFHAKLTLIEFAAGNLSAAAGAEEYAMIIGGSANFTRRNLNGYNLENALEIRAAATAPVAMQVAGFFNRLWDGRDGLYLVAYEHYAEQHHLKAAWAAWQEFSGMGTF